MRKTNIILTCFIIMLSLVACNSSANKLNETNQHDNHTTDNIEGTWSLDDNTSYYFDGLGSGQLILSYDKYNFTYTIANDQIYIDFESSIAKDSTYTYSVDNNVLNLTSKDENKGFFVLERVAD